MTKARDLSTFSPSTLNATNLTTGAVPNARLTAVPASVLANYPNDATKVLKGDGSWAVSSSGAVVVSTPTYTLGTGYTTAMNFSFSVAATSSLNGGSIDHFEVTYNGTLQPNVSATSNTATVTLLAPAIGTANIAVSIVAVDNYGNKSNASAKTANTTANTAPTFTLSNILVNGAVTGSFQTVQNTTNNTISFTGVTDAEGNTPITFTITPTTGGTQYSGFSKTSGIILSESITFTAPALASATTLSFSVVAIDSLGNASSPVTVSIPCITESFIPGTQGFGVGTYTGTLPNGVTTLTGTTDVTHANYGNYTFTDGSIMCWIPRFYYRIGSSSSPRFATYGANAIDIVSVNTYSTETTANAAGFAMHRAFVDGGAVKNGFFIDKYLASKNGSTSAKSIANVEPISLSTSTGYNPSNGMTGCTGILADAVVLSRARGTGFNTATIFQYNALAMLSLAHAQETARLTLGTTYCAWYDPTYNFPKGCNNGALKDVNDTSVTYTRSANMVTAGDYKPNTGSASPFAKTTHNGQANGVADLNGCIRQVMLGITAAGTTATDTSNISTGDQYVLKHSATHASLTGGWGGATDAWGTASSLLNNYDLITGFMIRPDGMNFYFGNGSNGVFAADIATSSAVASTAKTNYLKTCSGYPLSTGESATGTNQYGADQSYHYTISNQVPMGSGGWNASAAAGVFYRSWDYYRSGDYNSVGFRVAAYL